MAALVELGGEVLRDEWPVVPVPLDVDAGGEEHELRELGARASRAGRAGEPPRRHHRWQRSVRSGTAACKVTRATTGPGPWPVDTGELFVEARRGDRTVPPTRYLLGPVR
jgi:hypothetical protein